MSLLSHHLSQIFVSLHFYHLLQITQNQLWLLSFPLKIVRILTVLILLDHQQICTMASSNNLCQPNCSQLAVNINHMDWKIAIAVVDRSHRIEFMVLSKIATGRPYFFRNCLHSQYCYLCLEKKKWFIELELVDRPCILLILYSSMYHLGKIFTLVLHETFHTRVVLLSADSVKH